MYLPQAFDPDQSQTQNPYNPHRFKPQFVAIRNNSPQLPMRHFCANSGPHRPHANNSSFSSSYENFTVGAIVTVQNTY
jgi:hypothetical protein